MGKNTYSLLLLCPAILLAQMDLGLLLYSVQLYDPTNTICEHPGIFTYVSIFTMLIDSVILEMIVQKCS